MASGKKQFKSSGIRASVIFSLLLLIGLTFLFRGIFLKYKAHILSFNSAPPVVNQDNNYSDPKRIIVEKAGIDLSIEPSKIENGVWQVSQTGVSFLSSSARPGEGGNIIIYGHNKKHILGNLIGLNLTGELIEIIDDKGESFFYKIEEIKIVDPSDVKVVAPTDYEVLTLYTCTGFLDSKRLVLKAYPI